MTKTKRSSLHRVISLFVIVLTVAALLCSLSSCSSSKDTLTQGNNTEAGFASDVLKNHSDSLYKFIAASRGYDMNDESFDSNADAPKKDTPDIDAAKEALKTAITNASFKKTEDKTTIEAYAENLTAEDITAVISSLGTEYELENETGFFGTLLLWIGKFLGFLTRIFGNYYIVAILVFAVIVEILMLPVAIKQQKNSIGMAKMRPKIAKIEKKYAGRTDQATLRKKQEEIMELQQQEGYSPFSGCLPLLLQLIIVGFILYPIIINPLHYILDTSEEFSSALMSYATAPKAAGGLGVSLSGTSVIELLSNLSSENIKGIADFALIENGTACLELFEGLTIPDFSMFGINLGATPTLSFNILVLVPILNVAIQWITMKLNKRWNGNGMAAEQDAQSKSSMKIMELVAPLMTLFIMFRVPAIIGVYWLFRSAISLAKQFALSQTMPVPRYTAEELRDMEKAEKEKQKNQRAILKEQPKYRSLHYIDEDDYEELPDLTKKPEETKRSHGIDMPEIKD